MMNFRHFGEYYNITHSPSAYDTHVISIIFLNFQIPCVVKKYLKDNKHPLSLRSETKYCPLTNIQAYLCVKWRLLPGNLHVDLAERKPCLQIHIRSDEGLTLETPAFQLITVANLHFQLS